MLDVLSVSMFLYAVTRYCSYLYGVLQSMINFQKKSFDPQLSAVIYSQVIASTSCHPLSAAHKALVTWRILIIIDIETGTE